MFDFRINHHFLINEFKQCFNQSKYYLLIFLPSINMVIYACMIKSKGFDTKKSLYAVSTSLLEKNVFWSKKSVWMFDKMVVGESEIWRIC